MPGLTAIRATAGALAVTTIGLISLAAAPAVSATPIAGETGSIVYVTDGNVWLSTPDGTTFSTRSGTVKLTVTTSGKTVAIDGLLLSRT
jgi:hypothetical protein